MLPKTTPQHFEEFIKENSHYTAPDIEEMLSRKHLNIATRRLETLQLPLDQQVERMVELDRELKHFDRAASEIRQDLENYKQGKVSDTLLQTIKYLSENAPVRQAQSLQTSVPKLARRLSDMKWSVHKYSQDAFRFTSDSPLLILPTAMPASENDWEALSLYSMTYLGEVHFYTDEIIEDHPPMIFIFPLTPHLDLFITPYDDKTSPIADVLLDQDMADTWNRLQVIQARRFVFSTKNDFSIVHEAVEEYLMHREMVEKRIPARIEDEPHLNKKEPRHKRWMLL